MSAAFAEKYSARIRIQNFRDVIQTLKNKGLLSEAGQHMLNSISSDIPKDLFHRMTDNSLRKKNSRKAYSSHLRRFALTPQFYSPKAYAYVYSTFEPGLPHPSVITTWYGSIDGSPDHCGIGSFEIPSERLCLETQFRRESHL